MEKYYVYKHSDKGKVVYIGRGIKNRAWCIKNRSTKHVKLILKNLHKNIESIKVIKYFHNKMDACKYETELINKLKPKFNETWTQEYKYKIAMSNPRRRPVTYLGKKYNSLRECARMINKSTSFLIPRVTKFG